MDARYDELTRRVNRLFEPTPGLPFAGVGVEIELFPVRLWEGGAMRVTIAEMQRALTDADMLTAESAITFEPGGQIELSPEPAPSADALLRRITGMLTRLSETMRATGISLMAEGVNRWLTSDEVGLQKPTERYRKMQAHFDAIGPTGRQMMRRTASLQVCVDLLPGRAGEEEWHLLNRCGPALAAAFANQRDLACLRNPHSESRSRIWQTLDPSRTGFDGRQVGPDRASSYRDFALEVEVIPLDAGHDELSPFRAPLADWLVSGHERPTSSDLAHHLTTLFPPVRPRGRYVEVRYLDALPLPWLAVPVCLLATLVNVSPARRAALDLLGENTSPILQQWQRSARNGLADQRIYAEAKALVEIALTHMDSLPSGYLPENAADLIRDYWTRFAQMGRAPADESSEIAPIKEPVPCV